jgi:hypothetical protein
MDVFNNGKLIELGVTFYKAYLGDAFTLMLLLSIEFTLWLKSQSVLIPLIWSLVVFVYIISWVPASFKWTVLIALALATAGMLYKVWIRGQE